MAHIVQDTHLEPGDSISVSDRRISGGGCVLTFARDTLVYLTPQQETELLVMLMERQTGVGRAQAAYGLIGGMDGAPIPVLLHRRPKPRLVGDDSPGAA